MSTTITETKHCLTVKEFRKVWQFMRPLASRNTVPILNYLMVHSNGSLRTIYATDLDLYIGLDYQGGECDRFLVPREMVASALKGAKPSDSLIFEKGSIKVGDLEYTFEVPEDLEKDEFPQPFNNSEKVELNKSLYPVELLKAVRYASNDETRYIMNGVWLGNKRFAATDGRRLLVLPTWKYDSDFIMPSAACHAAKIFDDEIWMGFDARHAVMRCGNKEIRTRRVEGRYPKIDQVIPDHSKAGSSVSISDQFGNHQKKIITFLKTHPEWGKRGKPTTVLNCAGTSMFIQHKHEGRVAASLEIRDCMIGLDIQIAVDPRLFCDVVEDVETLHIFDELSPIVGTFRGQPRVVLMPIRI